MAQLHRKDVDHHVQHIPVTTGYRCEICGGLFAKPYLLRTHEQKCHDLFRAPQDFEALRDTTNLRPPKVTTVVIPAIQTVAMGVVRAREEIPFAVLHMHGEIPLIVRVIEQGQHSVLKAAENSDFRESQRGGAGLVAGSSVTIALVATIFQRLGENGVSYFEVTGPVACYQKKMPAVEMGETEEEQFPGDEVLQESLASDDIHKTLTQLNAPVTRTVIKSGSSLVPALRPHQVLVPQPATSAKQKVAPKRKNQSKPTTRRGQPPAKQAAVVVTPTQPKVVTVFDDQQWWDDQNTAPCVNSSLMVAGPLLSPIRRVAAPPPPPVVVEVIPIEQADPLANLDMLDLIRVDDVVLPIDLEDAREASLP